MAMSYLWAGLLAVSLFCGLLNGGEDLGRAALAGTERAVELALGLAGPLVLWSGFAALLDRSGLRAALARLLGPALGRLFPGAAGDPEAMGAICGNVTANLLGLGNAATPLGVAAAKRLRALSCSDAASDELCRFVVLNTASVQLLPTTAAALRGSLGSATPFDILPAVWLSSALSVGVGLGASALFARAARRASRRRKRQGSGRLRLQSGPEQGSGGRA